MCEDSGDAFTKVSAMCVKITFKIYQSCMDVRKQYAVRSAEQKKTNPKN